MDQQDTIKPLFDLPDSFELLAQFQSLIFQKKFKEAISFGKRKFKNGAPSYTYYTGLSICYSQLNKPKEAIKVLDKAVTLYPDNSDIYYYLGQYYFDLEIDEEAEEYFLKSLELTPADKRIERSECLNNLGVLYWSNFRKDEALDCWKDAVKENPFNNKAQENLKDFSNEYGEPKASNSLFDDLYHFQNIHKKKYLELKAKSDFDSIEEMEQWTELTAKKWNEIMEVKIPELSSMTSVQKSVWFNSITIDYSMISKAKKTRKNANKSSSDKRNSFRKGFSFLDADMLVFLPLTVPILSLSGLEKERFEEIVKGSRATADEEGLFFWAFEFLETVLESATKVSVDKQKQLLYEAKQIALEILEEVAADDAINMTRELCHDFLGDLSGLKLNKRYR
jgi:tetratricopeptide (TPR) repeat protein